MPNTTNISFDGVEAESLLIALDLEGFAVSTGSACSSGTLEPSHVLRAMNLPSHRTQNSIRFSLGAGNTEAQVDSLIAKSGCGREAARWWSKLVKDSAIRDAKLPSLLRTLNAIALLEIESHANICSDVGRRGFVGGGGAARARGARRHRPVDAAV